MWLPLLPCPFLGGVCTGVGGGKVCTSGSQTGAEKPADRKSPARLGDQMTRLTGVTEEKETVLTSTAAKSWPTCPPQSLLSSEGELVPRRPARA